MSKKLNLWEDLANKTKEMYWTGLKNITNTKRSVSLEYNHEYDYVKGLDISLPIAFTGVSVYLNNKFIGTTNHYGELRTDSCIVKGINTITICEPGTNVNNT